MTVQIQTNQSLPKSFPMTDLTRQLQGREIAAVLCNGTVVLIQTKDGREIAIKWVDDNGVALKGRPVISQKGLRMKMRGFRDLLHLPGLIQ
jgi:hypothetical protein